MGKKERKNRDKDEAINGIEREMQRAKINRKPQLAQIATKTTAAVANKPKSTNRLKNASIESRMPLFCKLWFGALRFCGCIALSLSFTMACSGAQMHTCVYTSHPKFETVKCVLLFVCKDVTLISRNEITSHKRWSDMTAA